MKILVLILLGIAVIYLFSGNKDSSRTSRDNYGQYDKGTALCDKGAAGDVSGLCD